MTISNKFTLVRHSAYGYKDDPRFRRAVELVGLSNKTEENLVRRAGGVLFDSYEEADAAENNVNYPPGHPEGLEGLIPNAQGEFSAHAINGLAIYQPKSVTVT